MKIDHNEQQGTIAISMPNYIAKAIRRFNIGDLTKKYNSPGRCNGKTYGAQVQTTEIDRTEPINEERRKVIQQIVGVILFYARAIDYTMLVEVNKLSSKQAKPTVQVEEDAVQILRYAATWPTASLVYKKSDMKLRIHSDASYNSEPIARSRAGGYFDLISEDNDPYTEPVNGGILAVSALLDVVVASAGEAELGGLFINAQHGEIIRATLKDLGYPQHVTPIYTDNKCAEGIANENITLHKSKSMDMRFMWIRDRVRQLHFSVTWKKGSENLADYFTKSHPTAHHQAMRQVYVTDVISEQLTDAAAI